LTIIQASFWYIFTAHAQKRLIRASGMKSDLVIFSPAPSISYKTDEFLLPSDVFWIYM